MKICLLYVGRPRDRAANLMADEYARRIGRFCDFRMQQVSDDKALGARARAYKIALDPRGRQVASQDLARLIAQSTRELVFLVGGADGLSDTARSSADLLLALSRLTLPHELARVILTEQIYRAFAILRNHPYAR